MTDYKKLYQERKTRVETAVAGGQPDRVPNVLLVGTYPIHKAGMTMAESMVDHEKACQAMLSFYETHSCTDTASISNFMPAAKTLENLDVKTPRDSSRIRRRSPSISGCWQRRKKISA